MKKMMLWSLLTACVAGYAAGLPQPSFTDKMDEAVPGCTLTDGLYGKALVTGTDAAGRNHFRQYTGVDRFLDHKEGTVAFWFKPLDWDSSYTGMQTFFSARGDDGWLMIYKYPDLGSKSGASNRLLFLFGNPVGSRFKIAKMNRKNDFKRNQWRFIAATWKNDDMVLYLDGKPVVTDKAPVVPTKIFKTITLGAASNPAATSAIDELSVYRNALSQTEIYQLYEKTRPVRSSQVKAVTIGRGAAHGTPVLDGQIRPDEYPVQLTGMLEISQKSRFAATQSECFAGYDAENLYLAVRTPGEKLTADGTDSTICWDDAIELYVSPGRTRSKVAHWIVNSRGRVYSELNQKSGWKAPGFQSVSKVSGGVWTLEAKIPFASLGVKAPADGEVWELNFCRTVTFPKVVYTSFGPSSGSYLAGLVPVRFDSGAPAYAVRLNGNLNTGNIEFGAASPKCVLSGKLCPDGSPEQPVADGGKFRDFGDTGTLDLAVKSGSNTLYQAEWAFRPIPAGTYFQQYLFTDIAEKKVHVGIYQPQPLIDGEPTRGKLLLQDLSGKTVSETSFQASTCNFEVVLPWKGIAPGDYKLYLELADHAGKQLWHWRDDYRIYPPGPTPWSHCEVGLSKKVPAPWTPLTVDGDTVKVWGREYRFNRGNLWPVQIVSQGEKLLAAPIGLWSGRKEFRGESLRITRLDDTAAEISTSGSLDGIKAEVKARLEYDGFTWFTLTLESGQPVRLENLSLRIPYAPAAATLRNLADYKLQRTGATPKESFTKDLLNEHPVFWLGSDSAGLQFVAETLRNFNLKDPAAALTVTPSAAQTVAEVRIFDHPVNFQGKRVYEFGLEATPARPVEKTARKWRIWRNIRINFNGLFQFYSYPDAALVSKEVEQSRRKIEASGCRVSPYMAAGAASPLSPEYKFYGDTWRLTPPPQGWDRIRPDRVDLPGVNDNNQWIHYLVCINSADYRNFYLSRLVETAKALKLSGCYFDWAQIFRCDNELHGCGWIDWNGRRQRTYGVRGLRDFTRRLWTEMREYDPEFMVWLHMSGEPVMAAHAFSSILLDGENLAGGVLQQESYYKLLPLDTFRAGYTSRNWGPQIFIAPQFTRVAEMYNPSRMAYWKSPESLPPKKHLIGLALVHDSMLHSCFGLDQNEEFAIMDRFGWDDALVFHPYWQQRMAAFTNGTPETVVSIYERPERLMLVPLNNTPESRSLELNIQTGKLGLPANFSLTDEHTGQKYQVKNGRLVLSMAPYSFRMLSADKGK